jgi:hypothetical protein
MKYRVNKDLTVRNIADETFIMDRDNGIVHSFNSSGVFMWKEVVEGIPFEEIVLHVRENFETSEADVEEDVFQFLNTLEKSGLITISES